MRTRHRLRAATTGLVAALALVAAVLPASATPEFRFTTRGWGHGIGLTQYGALEQAAHGRSARDIIEHYYSGATTATPDLDLGHVDVGLAQDRTSVVITPRGTAARVRFGATVLEVDAGTPVKFGMWRSDGRCHLIVDGTATQHSRSSCEGRVERLHGGRLDVSTESNTFGRGRILVRPRGNDPSRFHVVARLSDVETYLYGLREVPSTWPRGALRAQAIAARSYAAHDLLGGGVDPNGCGCHLYDSVQSQVYGGTTGETAAWRAAVDATAGRVIHAPGQPGTRSGVVQAFYSSSSGGRTENIEDVWDTRPRGYLSSVDDAWSLEDSNPYASWATDVPESRIRRAFGLDDVTAITVASRNESGSARTVVISGTRDGSPAQVTRSGYELRGELGIRSAWITSVFLPPFTDDDGNVHEPSIAWLAARRITRGCDETGTRFCPERAVTRAQMATLLTNALDLPPARERFADVPSDHTHAANIGALAAAGITRGCNADGTRFCPGDPVTRAQMATFLTNALDLPPARERFADVPSDHTHAANIGALAAAGITRGCNADGTRFCPGDPVTRAQMATFLRQGLG